MTKHCNRPLKAEFYYPPKRSDSNFEVCSFTFWTSAENPKDIIDIAIRQLKEYYANSWGVSAGRWCILKIWGKDISGNKVVLAKRISRNCPEPFRV